MSGGQQGFGRGGLLWTRVSAPHPAFWGRGSSKQRVCVGTRVQTGSPLPALALLSPSLETLQVARWVTVMQGDPCLPITLRALGSRVPCTVASVPLCCPHVVATPEPQARPRGIDMHGRTPCAAHLTVLTPTALSSVLHSVLQGSRPLWGAFLRRLSASASESHWWETEAGKRRQKSGSLSLSISGGVESAAGNSCLSSAVPAPQGQPLPGGSSHRGPPVVPVWSDMPAPVPLPPPGTPAALGGSPFLPISELLPRLVFSAIPTLAHPVPRIKFFEYLERFLFSDWILSDTPP